VHLAVAARSAITTALGSTANAVIDPLLDRYRLAATSKGIEADVLIVDDAQSMARFGMMPLASISADLVRAVIGQAHTALLANGNGLDSVLLFGGPRIFPFFNFVNPVIDRALDPDATVPSDNPYGVISATASGQDWLVPTLPIGRIYDAGSVQTFADAIRSVIANHEAPAPRHGSCAIYNGEWMQASVAVAGELAKPLDLQMSPPYQVNAANRTDLDRRVVYINLHGFDGQIAWKSYDAGNDVFLDVLTPESFTAATTAGSFVVSEACYGGQVADRSVANSCALSAHVAGGTVIAATGLVWGSVLRPWAYIDSGDALAKHVIGRMGVGLPIGTVLSEGRRLFVLARQGAPDGMSAFEQKTALQFILMGDPSLPA